MRDARWEARLPILPTEQLRLPRPTPLNRIANNLTSYFCKEVRKIFAFNLGERSCWEILVWPQGSRTGLRGFKRATTPLGASEGGNHD